MKTIAKFAVLAWAMFTFVSARASAQHPPGPGGPRADCTNRLATYVGLSDAQKAALETLRQQTTASIGPVADQARALHQQVDAALSAAAPDRCAIGDLVIEEHALRQQIETIRTSAEAAFVASLSADQQAKYSAFLAANPGCAAFPTRIPILATFPA